MKVYFVRHQAAGIVSKYPFAEHPTAEQVHAVAKECFQSFGFGHTKTPDEPYWTTVVESEVLGPDDVPVVPDRSLSVTSAAGVGEFSVTGTGTVAPREMQTLTADDVGELVLTSKAGV